MFSSVAGACNPAATLKSEVIKMIRLVKRNELTNETKLIGLFADDKAVLEYVGPEFKIYDKVYKNNTRYTHTRNNVTYILYDNSVNDDYQLKEPMNLGIAVLTIGYTVALISCFTSFWLLGVYVLFAVACVISKHCENATVERKGDSIQDDHETVGMMKGARL